MATIQFFGASGTVTGSCYLFTIDNYKLLIDCGMFQGTTELEAKNFAPLGFDPSTLDAVILTHAHLDHCGRLPLLIIGGFNGPIYCTQATCELAEIVLMDSAKISAKERPNNPMYTIEAVDRTLDLMRVVRYQQELLLGSLRATFFDAGHILGSATIHLQDDKRGTYIFSGDLGNSPQDLIRPTHIPPTAQVVVMESTYGDRLHPEEDAMQVLAAEIRAIEKSGGALLIPAFSIERTQELLHLLHHLKETSRIDAHTPVFLDSPMASRVTQVFRRHDKLFNQELKDHQKYYTDPFDFEGLMVTRKAKERQKINSHNGPKLIIAGSGMMMGGRILAHASRYLPMPTTRLLFSGFQAPDTLGRMLLEGDAHVEIEGLQVEVRATISQLKALSSHADQSQLLSWLTAVRPEKKVILTHGEDVSRVALAQKIKDLDICDQVYLPHHQESISL